MSYPAIHEPATAEEAINVLQDAMNYVVVRYGGTEAHRILAIAHRTLKLERFKKAYSWDRSLVEHIDKQIAAMNPAYVQFRRIPAEAAII